MGQRQDTAMDAAPISVGIDGGKASRGLAAPPPGQQPRLTNDDVRIAELGERFQAIHPVLVLLGATGGLDVPVTAALAAAGHAVVVINPVRSGISKEVGQLAKADVLDAHVLARFAAAGPPHALSPA
jgi:transposase